MTALSKTERLVLANQFRILALLDSDSSTEYDYFQEILEAGYEVLYPEIFESIDKPVPLADGEEAIDILTMFQRLQTSLGQLNNQAGLDPSKLRFAGFDGNTESGYYHLIKVMVKAGKWKELEKPGLNSHHSTLPRYRAMLKEFNSRFKWDSPLTYSDLLAIQDAGKLY